MGSFASGKAGVDNGSYYAAVTFPANFSKVLFLRNTVQSLNASVTVYIDGTNPTIETAVLAALQSSLQNTFGSGGVVLDEQFAFGGVQFSGLDVSIPAVIGLVLTQVVLLISIITLVKETTSGVLSRLYATPLSAFERLRIFICASHFGNRNDGRRSFHRISNFWRNSARKLPSTLFWSSSFCLA